MSAAPPRCCPSRWALLGLFIIALSLGDVRGFVNDLISGTTTTGYPPDAPERISRATDAGRYWFLLFAWLQHVAIGLMTLVFSILAWRARRRSR